MRKFKHLSENDRYKMEALLKAKHKPREIADILHVHISTIYREMKRGRYTHKNSDWTMEERYSPDIAQKKYRENLSAKGPALKIGSDHELAQYIERKIVDEDYSPAAVLGEIRTKGIFFKTTISINTLYSYIDKGLFLELTNKKLPVKGKKKRPYHKVKKQARAARGESIENRPEEVNARETFGHWEMDCVEGKKRTKKTLLVLTERLTRREIIVLMKDKTAESVVKALDRLERRLGKMFYKIFKTITVDNGSEFADCAGIERARYRKGKRTNVYYCHPYSSWERGSNENQNRMIRRRYPKGTDFTGVSTAEITQLENWVNEYPRAILGYSSSMNEFQKCLAEMG